MTNYRPCGKLTKVGERRAAHGGSQQELLPWRFFARRQVLKSGRASNLKTLPCSPQTRVSQAEHWSTLVNFARRGSAPMLSLTDARDRSMRRAVKTGEMAEMDFIHTIQQAEGHQACFGRTREPCPQIGCRWHAECAALAGTEVFPWRLVHA